MFSTSDYTGVYAQVQEILGEFWHDFEIDEIISRAYKFDGEKYECTVDEAGFWKIAAECDKCATEGVNERYDYRAVIRDDIREAVTDYDLSEFATRDEAEDSLNEALWIDDTAEIVGVEPDVFWALVQDCPGVSEPELMAWVRARVRP